MDIEWRDVFMKRNEMMAMLLAGGQGSRLGILTMDKAKPAVAFGGKYRIIDFPMSNCVNSGVDTVGVLTQYQPLTLNAHIGIGVPWDLDRVNGGVSILAPHMREGEIGSWYSGTANAIYQNIDYIDSCNPEYVLILSGDHIYKMHYGEMLKAHKESGAAVTIAVMPVPWEEASRFGIMNVDEEGTITDFEEKPAEPKSNLASMGIYIFTYEVLKKYLEADERDPSSANDFGKNIIPTMLENGEKMVSFRFEGYWKDVGTIHSLWEANMDLVDQPPKFDLNDRSWSIYSRNMALAPHYVGQNAKITNSTVTEGCFIDGEIKHSVIFGGVELGEGSVVSDSVIMPGAKIGKNVVIEKAVIGADAVIGDGAKVGVNSSDDNKYASKLCTNDLVLIESGAEVGVEEDICKGSMVEA